jgi:muconolactone delta-isomerase
MKIIAIEKDLPGKTAEDFQPHLIPEARRVWELHQAGIIRELYFRQDEHTAVLVLECASLEEAQAALDSLPLVQAGLITFELLPLRAYDGFARLFAKG